MAAGLKMMKMKMVCGGGAVVVVIVAVVVVALEGEGGCPRGGAGPASVGEVNVDRVRLVGVEEHYCRA